MYEAGRARSRVESARPCLFILLIALFQLTLAAHLIDHEHTDHAAECTLCAVSERADEDVVVGDVTAAGALRVVKYRERLDEEGAVPFASLTGYSPRASP